MSQRGILSFFSKSPAASTIIKPNQTKPPPKTTPRRRKAFRKGSSEKGNENSSEMAEGAGGSPVIKHKAKKRRVLDSDESDNGETENKTNVPNVTGTDITLCGTTNNSNEDNTLSQSSANTDSQHLQEEESSVVTASRDVDPMNTTSDEHLLSSTTRVATSESPVTSTSNAELLKTPPRRNTARKHTGKMDFPISRSEPTPSSNGRLSSPESKPKRRKLKSLNSEKKAKLDTGSDVGETADLIGIQSMECSSNKESDEAITVEDSKPAMKDVVKTMDSKESSSEHTFPSTDTAAERTTPNKEGTSVINTITDEKPAIHPFFAPRPTDKLKKGTKEKVGSEDAPIKDKRPASLSNGVSQKAKSTSVKENETDNIPPSKSEVKDIDYNPSLTSYHPVNDACWKRGQKVPYLAIAKTFEVIEEESKRLKIVSTLTNLFRSVLLLSPNEMVHCVYLCLNKLAPAYEGLELGIGESFLMKAIAGAMGRSVQHIKADNVVKGDLGIVAEMSRGNQRTMFAPPKLTVSGVFSKFKDIASMTGSTSQAKKVDMIKGLLVACRQSEARYLTRSLGGKLRIGLAEQSVLTAIAHSVVYTPPCKEWPPVVMDASKCYSADKFQAQLDEANLKIKSSYCELPNYDVLISALITHGVETLSEYCKLTPGIPLKPMLAHPTKGVQEVLRRFEGSKFTCEWKYDGERAQIHLKEGGEIRIYSRNSEDNTSKYPDIIGRMPKVIDDSVTSFVLDAEAVGWDTESKQILPFQILSTRKRKDADVSSIKVQVCVFVFDLLYLNGKSLVKEPFMTRRELLKSSFNSIEGEFMFAKAMDSSDVEEIQEFMEESIRGNCEGLMVKTLDKEATYEISKRSHNWLKLKKDYLEGVGDTIDLVVIGGFHGSGKRAGKYGGFLLACYDEDSEEFQAICKIGTGFKDEDLEQHNEFFKKHIVNKPKQYYRVNGQAAQPDHWFDAVQVWEVKAADLSISPVYTAAAGIVDPEKGISLRFPRFLRIRDDKKPEAATSSSQIADMYRSQQNNAKSTAASYKPEDFY